jgi:hypothetical protein
LPKQLHREIGMEAFELLAFPDDENGIVSGRQVLGLQIG